MIITRNFFLILLAMLVLLCCGACAPAETGIEETDAAMAAGEADIVAGNIVESADNAEIPPPAASGEAALIEGSDDGPALEDEMPERQADIAAEAAATAPAPENAGAAPAAVDEPVILTISGAGVSGETVWTLGRLQSLKDGYREFTYSTTNNWPTFGHMTAQGISLPYLLRQAGMLDNAASCKFTATDGYYVVVTYAQIFDAQYAYTRHSPDGSGGAQAVEPVIAWVWGDGGSARPENIRPFFGQSGPLEVNTSAFVKNLCEIEVLAAPAGTWAAPQADIAAGSTVPSGTELRLLHDSLDSVRVYYTVDGSEPDYNSPVYNPSTSYFQPQLITPLLLTENVTIKAFAAAYGKERSPVATFNYIVE